MKQKKKESGKNGPKRAAPEDGNRKSLLSRREFGTLGIVSITSTLLAKESKASARDAAKTSEVEEECSSQCPVCDCNDSCGDCVCNNCATCACPFCACSGGNSEATKNIAIGNEQIKITNSLALTTQNGQQVINRDTSFNSTLEAALSKLADSPLEVVPASAKSGWIAGSGPGFKAKVIPSV